MSLVTGLMGEVTIIDGTADTEATFTVSAREHFIRHKGKASGDKLNLTVEFGKHQTALTTNTPP